METFTRLKPIVHHPQYQMHRQNALRNFSDATIDLPIIHIVKAFNELTYCFTLQSCYGHFVHPGQKDRHNLEPLPRNGTLGRVTYRIAYIALCIENSLLGRELFDALDAIPAIDPQNIQFCSSDWFWKRQINSYVLQVEPDRFKHQDTAVLDFAEAFYIEQLRNEFFSRLKVLLDRQKQRRPV